MKRIVNVIEHFDCGGQTYVIEPGQPERLARPNEDLDRLIETDDGIIIERMPVFNPPRLIKRHIEGETCELCDELRTNFGGC